MSFLLDFYEFAKNIILYLSTNSILSYNIGLLLTVIMMAIRGCVEVLNPEISATIDSSISGIAGLGHIIMAIAYILFFLLLLNRINDFDSNKSKQ